MASHRRRRRSSLKGFGNIISVRKGVDGLFDLDTPTGVAMPIILGAGLTIGAAYAVKKLVPMAAAAVAPAGTSGLSDTMRDNAPLVGALAGTLAGLGLWYGMKKPKAGVAMIATSAVLGGVLQYQSKLGLAGFGAIVPEYGMGAMMPMMNGLGATVLEEWNPGQRPDSIGALSGAYGTTVDLSGLGAVNTGAFGTPGFHV